MATAAQMAAGSSALIPYKKISAATTNATSVKAGPGFVGNIVTGNSGAAAAYLKFYDKASAPTVGTDTPVFVVRMPIAGTVAVAGTELVFAVGIAFAITALPADSDTTAVGANEVSASFGYR